MSDAEKSWYNSGRKSLKYMALMPKFAPRIHDLLAANDPLAVALRRGPSKSVCGADRELKCT
jgi:hypothetical protein